MTVWMGEGKNDAFSYRLFRPHLRVGLCAQGSGSVCASSPAAPLSDETVNKENAVLRWLDERPAWLTVSLSFVLLLIAWQLLVWWGDYPPFILPGPADVLEQFGILLSDGRLVRHSLVTISEVIPGLILGVAVALPLGYLLTKSPLADRLISPYLIASQAIPIIAIAPLLTIWIQSWYWSRVLVAALVVFFPVLITIIAGLRSVPPELYDLMRSLRANPRQVFLKLELPAALPSLLAGLKIGADPGGHRRAGGRICAAQEPGAGLSPGHGPLPIQDRYRLCGTDHAGGHRPVALRTGGAAGETAAALAYLWYQRPSVVGLWHVRLNPRTIDR